MAWASNTTWRSRWQAAPLWLPVFLAPFLTLMLFHTAPAWMLMWALALSIYVGCKCLTYADAVDFLRPSFRRSLAYLLLWPGMDAGAFLNTASQSKTPSARQWAFGFADVVIGATLLGSALALLDPHPYLAACMGMGGIVFLLHFGLFHLLSLLWRQFGIEAEPLMHAPIYSASLSEFWGRRWNTAFQSLAHTYVFRPLVRPLGTVGATVAVFAVSGVIHDVVISLPARGGFGLPTAYYMIQCAGTLFERTSLGRRLGLKDRWRGRIFAALVLVLPLPLHFHHPFVEEVVLPMLRAMGGG